MSKKIQFSVKNTNILELQENACAGDILDLSEKINVDTKAIEARVAEEIAFEKDRQFKAQLEAEKKSLKAEAEKEKTEAISKYKEEISRLEAEKKGLENAKTALEKATEAEKKSALELKEGEVKASYEKKISNYEVEISRLNAEKTALEESKKTALKAKDDEKASALSLKESEMAKAHQSELDKLQKQIDSAEQEKELALSELRSAQKDELAKKQEEIQTLQTKVDTADKDKTIAVNDAVSKKEASIAELKLQNQAELNKKALEIETLKQEVTEANAKKEEELRAQKDLFEKELSMKDEQIAQYKDFKTRMSTKMVGESLEQHCYSEFQKVHMLAFPKATFIKDSNTPNGTKGDFIYREVDENGVEILSIMFEMKNEMDETSTSSKQKNEGFFAKLDKDRKDKKCEYAVLVTMLEADSDLYNQGIVDVSYAYEKMYVVRPHMFITLIGLLRQAALNAHQYKVKLAELQDANIDITNFEGKLDKFKDDFMGHYESATKNHTDAIREIDAAIKKLYEVRESLTKSDRYLGLCHKDIDGISVKKLTRGNSTMKKLFDEAAKEAAE